MHFPDTTNTLTKDDVLSFVQVPANVALLNFDSSLYVLFKFHGLNLENLGFQIRMCVPKFLHGGSATDETMVWRYEITVRRIDRFDSGRIAVTKIHDKRFATWRNRLTNFVTDRILLFYRISHYFANDQNQK